jgi:phosphate transport system permease protein
MTTLPASPPRAGQAPGAAPLPGAPRVRPRPVTARTADDWLSLVGSLIGSGGFTWVCYYRLLPFSGRFGFLVCWYACFLLFYAAVSAMANPRPVVADRIAAAVVHGGALLVLVAVATTIFYTFAEGRHALPHLNFFVHDMNGVVPTAALNQGGIAHAIAGTLIELAIATIVSLPLGLGTAIFIAEVGGRFARFVRTVVEAMTALPDIVAGLFVYTTLIVALHVPTSGFAAAMALSVTMLPVIARSSEVVLRVVPGGLREASLALGATRWRTVMGVVLPTARTGLASALILGMARGIGETAPVLLTSAASTYFTLDPFKPMNSLPLFIFRGWQSGEPLYMERAWGAASVLLGMVLVLFVTARLTARQRYGRS